MLTLYNVTPKMPRRKMLVHSWDVFGKNYVRRLIQVEAHTAIDARWEVVQMQTEAIDWKLGPNLSSIDEREETRLVKRIVRFSNLKAVRAVKTIR